MGELFKNNSAKVEEKIYLKKEVSSNSIVQDMVEELNSKELIKGVILSEILGKPLSKRRRRR